MMIVADEYDEDDDDVEHPSEATHRGPYCEAGGCRAASCATILELLSRLLNPERARKPGSMKAAVPLQRRCPACLSQ